MARHDSAGPKPRTKLPGGVSASLRNHTALEEKLLQSQRWEVLGRLTGAVAHDFNNLLTIIVGNSQMILDGLSPEVQTRAVSEIIQAAKRADSLTRQLLGLSRNQPLGEQLVDLNEQIVEVKALLQRLLGNDVELITSHAATSKIRVEPTLTQQILLNLTVNAKEAMPLGGTLTIATDELRIGQGSPTIDGMDLPQGAYVTLVVRDSGVGMTQEVVERIFEPFFSTKPRGANTGLGLATVRGAVDRNGGHITVRTKPGHGTTFCIAFPMAENAAVINL